MRKSTILSYLAGDEKFGNRSIFPPRNRDEEMHSSIYISQDQIVFIEMSSVYNQAATNDLIPLVSQQGVLEVSNVTWNLRLVRWALSVSHVILVVSENVFEPNVFQLMNSAEIIHAMDSALGEGSYPEPIYVCNKTNLELLDKMDGTQEFQKQFTSVIGRTPRISTNYFVLPHIKYDMEHYRFDEFKRSIMEFNRYNRAPFAPDKDGLAKLAQKHNIQDWFQNASRLWDDMNFLKLGFEVIVYSLAASAVPDQKTVEETIYETIERLVQTRSFRRVSIIAGVGSVVIAAWYILRKLSAEGHSVPVPITPSLIVEEGVAVPDHQDHDHLVEAPPEDEKVVIHCCPRGYFTPCIATAPFQLETYLRVTNIPYEVSFCSGANGHNTPFLTIGNKIADDFRSSIRLLSEKHYVDLEKDASASRKTASHLVEVMGILIWRYIFDEGKSIKKIQPIYPLEEVQGFMSDNIKEATMFQPIGRLSREEFVQTFFQGIQDMSAALGKHPYFMGQSPGIVDCHAFAILAQLMWNVPDSPFESQIRRYSNLVEYVARMRDNYWPDWNQLIGKPEEYEALSVRDESISRLASEERLKRRRSSRSRGRDSSRGCKLERILTPGDNEELTKRKREGSSVKSETEKAADSPKPETTVESEKKVDVPESTPVAVKKEESQSQPKKEATPSEPSPPVVNVTSTANTNANVQPVGILKSNVVVAKQKSGLVSGSGANTNLTGQEVPNSDPTLSNQKQQPPLPPQQSRQPPPAQRQPTSLPAQQAAGHLPKQQTQQQQPLHQDSVLQVHKNSVKFADNATESVVFAMDEKTDKNVTEATKNSPSYTLSSINEMTSRKNSEIPVRKPNPEPLQTQPSKKTVAVILHEKQFPAKRPSNAPPTIPASQQSQQSGNVQVANNNQNQPPKLQKAATDNNQRQSLHYQQHIGNVTQTQQRSQSQPTQQQQYQPQRQQPPTTPQHPQQQFQQLRQQPPPQQQQQQQQFHSEHQQLSANQNRQQQLQPPRRETERAISAVNAVNNNNVMMSGPPQHATNNNYESIQIEGPPGPPGFKLQENVHLPPADENAHQQFYAQHSQMRQGYRAPYGRPTVYTNAVYQSPPPPMRYGGQMGPPAMSMFAQMPMEEFQKEAYYQQQQEYQYQNGMMPTSYVVADHMTPTMLQRFY
ncbi:hypothetical protein Ocin01_12925 [Orchesella cincta]|uniref:Metaxin glutathione S-transferase domain-containing protein n=1 Tax=Orchesella cincta TaxID=48709 RepID=A0A1D2ML50_ORCCI|nr:hypothetical protein Ocin01_12925 [Orchesella cincta]